jgi:hypothetical protein
MHHDFRRAQLPSDDEIRNIRLARGLRAVAATMVVGGIVLAAFDTTHAPRNVPRDASEAVVDYATGIPLVSPAPDVAPASGADDPALRRVDHAMENHG